MNPRAKFASIPAAAALVLAAQLAAAQAPAPVRPVKPRLSAEELALRQIQEEGRLQVEALARGLEGLGDGPELRALQRRIEEVKKGTRVTFLRAKVRFALERGDLDGAHEAERVLEALLNPRPVALPRPVETGRLP